MSLKFYTAVCLGVHALLALFPGHLSAQDSPAAGFKGMDHLMFGGGAMYNQPTLSENLYNIRRAVSKDEYVSFHWLRFIDPAWGAQLKVGFSTQSIRYKETRSTGEVRTVERLLYSKTGYFSLNLNGVYHTNLTRDFDLLFSLGPIAFINRKYDESNPGRDDFAGGFANHNIRRAGFGLYAGSHLIYRVSDRIRLVFNLGYQKGFIRFREAYIGEQQAVSTLNYSGSGVSFFVGCMFSLWKKENQL